MNSPYEEKLRQFAQDEVMFEAVRGLFLSNCDLNRIAEKLDASVHDNDRLGEIFRGFDAARAIINDTFHELEKYKTRTQDAPVTTNPV